jgi:hypothetical protein
MIKVVGTKACLTSGYQDVSRRGCLGHDCRSSWQSFLPSPWSQLYSRLYSYHSNVMFFRNRPCSCSVSVLSHDMSVLAIADGCIPASLEVSSALKHGHTQFTQLFLRPNVRTKKSAPTRTKDTALIVNPDTHTLMEDRPPRYQT